MTVERLAMEPLVIRKEIEVDAPAETVWRFVATGDGLRRWFKADTIVLDPRPGGRYEEHAVYENEPHHVIGEVLVYDPPHRFVHTYRAQRRDGSFWPADTVVAITVSVAGSRTRVVIEHSGFEQLPIDWAQHAYDAYSGGWESASARLPAVVRNASAQAAPPAVRREIEIAAPAEAVWPYVASEDGLRTWWSSTKSLLLEARTGGRFELRVVFAGVEYLITGRVLTYVRPRTFAVSWREVEGDWGAWPADTTVTFELSEQAGHTRVRVEHTGFERLPEAYRKAALESYEHGWTQEEMERLRALAEQATERARGGR